MLLRKFPMRLWLCFLAWQTVDSFLRGVTVTDRADCLLLALMSRRWRVRRLAGGKQWGGGEEAYEPYVLCVPWSNDPFARGGDGQPFNWTMLRVPMKGTMTKAHMQSCARGPW